MTLKVGAYNGQGESLNDVNNKKSFGARGTFGITPKLDVGASWFAHDGITTVAGVPDSSFTNYAWGVDAQWGKPGDEGLFALAEYLHGNDATAAKCHDAGHPGRGRVQHPDDEPDLLALRGRAAVPDRPRRPEHRRGQ